MQILFKLSAFDSQCLAFHQEAAIQVWSHPPNFFLLCLKLQKQSSWCTFCVSHFQKLLLKVDPCSVLYATMNSLRQVKCKY